MGIRNNVWIWLLRNFAPHPAAQLPVYTYFDPAYYELEQQLLFADAPQYYGHALMTPNVGDYHTLEWMGHGKMLKRNEDGIQLLSNVCRHRQALMLRARQH